MPNIRYLAHNKDMLYGYGLKKKLVNDDNRLGISERNVSFEILKRSKSLCDSWYTTQSDSINVLQSISNVISQRSATYDLPITLEDHGVNQPRLLFNQTESMEALFQKMKFFIAKFGDLNDKFHNLELEASRLVTKSLTLPSKSYPLSTESMIQYFIHICVNLRSIPKPN
ncbi:uncharacterized protein EV154DRAFT_549176 [Mucor mucedo]|uniref:uncharacterized protein n=1 Tax=Mucor mucedo TaxID=29922 RepID=UPI002220C8E2|nr:uncharacterized protein EV154DRAFT_549176 [Mucor mucedo]KAI7894489.1 hypothetical protein EV154DRAFT_549176 [Mucor mucedo]